MIYLTIGVVLVTITWVLSKLGVNLLEIIGDALECIAESISDIDFD